MSEPPRALEESLNVDDGSESPDDYRWPAQHSDYNYRRHQHQFKYQTTSTNQSNQELRLVCLGMTGSGKSSTANTLVGHKAFEVGAGASSVTRLCNHDTVKVGGRDIVVVDTPGLFDTSHGNDDDIREITRCVALSAPGPHALIVVVHGGIRATEQTQRCVNKIMKIFGDQASRYMIILFTHLDDIEYDGGSVSGFVQSLPPKLKQVLQRCDDRYLALNNRPRSDGENDAQVTKLFALVYRMVSQNGGHCLTNEVYKDVEAMIFDRERKLKKELEKKKEKERPQPLKHTEAEEERAERKFNKKVEELVDISRHAIRIDNLRFEVRQEVQDNIDGSGDLFNKAMQLFAKGMPITTEDDFDDVQNVINKLGYEDLQQLYHNLSILCRERSADTTEIGLQARKVLGITWKHTKNEEFHARDSASLAVDTKDPYLGKRGVIIGTREDMQEKAYKKDHQSGKKGVIFDIRDELEVPKRLEGISADSSFQPMSLDVSCGRASLHVPAGALAEPYQADDISLDVYDGDEYPPLDADHLMITPVISCSPDGLTFKHPAQLTIPHYVPMHNENEGDPRPNTSDVEAIQLWYRSPKKEWQKVPSVKTGDPSQPCWLKAMTQNSIILEVKSFSGHGASANTESTRHIRLYMQPSQITENTQSINVFVYAVKKALLKKVKEDERRKATVMCASKNEIDMAPNQKSLKITLRDILPTSKWIPLTIQQHIPYVRLQRGNPSAHCAFTFSKDQLAKHPATIKGYYDAVQEHNDDCIEGDLFDIDMFTLQLTTDGASYQPNASSSDDSSSSGDESEEDQSCPKLAPNGDANKPPEGIQENETSGVRDVIQSFMGKMKRKKVKKEITFDYHQDRAKVSGGEVVSKGSSITTTNMTTVPQAASNEKAYTTSVTKTRKWQFNNATAIKGNVKVKTNIPFFINGSFDIGLEDTFSIGYESWKQNTKAVMETFIFPVAVPEQSKVTATACLKKYTFEVPFTATITKGANTNRKEGVFCSEYFKAEYVFNEEKLASS